MKFGAGIAHRIHIDDYDFLLPSGGERQELQSNMKGNGCKMKGKDWNMKGNKCKVKGNKCKMKGNECNMKGNG